MRSVLSVSLPENISSELDKFARSTGRTVVGGIALMGGMWGWSSGMLASPRNKKDWPLLPSLDQSGLGSRKSRIRAAS
jgi:hypothetical protein